MLNTILFLLASIAATEIADRMVHPRSPRVWSVGSFTIRAGLALVAAGLVLGATGDAVLAFGAVALAAIVVCAGSNLKNRHLGEPLVFSDLAYLGVMARHPRLYIGVLPMPMRVVVLVAPLLVIAIGILAQSPSVGPHTTGLVAVAAGLLGLAISLRRLPATPDLKADVARDGLLATLARYWVRWRRERLSFPPPPPLARMPGAPAVVIVVQCESFVDAADLPGPSLRLPALEAARRRAVQQGRLMIDGFGAYTMRTEFGVLTGIETESLGFRRFDPFVRGAEAAACSLGTRFAAAGFDTRFVHPFELGFYGRDRLMPALGFRTLVGRAAFAGAERNGHYPSDPALGAMLAHIAAAANEPVLIYAVTMENHGPWAPPRGETALDAYRRHLVSSDAMLAGLLDLLDASARPMLLAFFGDHRPSIPGEIDPGPDRHTPYVVLSNRAAGPPCTQDLTPAGLHHALIRHAEGAGGASTAMPREAAAAASAPVI